LAGLSIWRESIYNTQSHCQGAIGLAGIFPGVDVFLVEWISLMAMTVLLV
jgi:hypothetical protein